MRIVLKIIIVEYNNDTSVSCLASFKRFLILDRLDMTALENTHGEVIT